MINSQTYNIKIILCTPYNIDVPLRVAYTVLRLSISIKPGEVGNNTTIFKNKFIEQNIIMLEIDVCAYLFIEKKYPTIIVKLEM